MKNEQMLLQQIVGVDPLITVEKVADVVNADGGDDPDDVID